MSRSSKKRRAAMAREREAVRRAEDVPDTVDPRAIAAEAPVAERRVSVAGSGRLWLGLMLAAAARTEDEP